MFSLIRYLINAFIRDKDTAFEFADMPEAGLGWVVVNLAVPAAIVAFAVYLYSRETGTDRRFVKGILALFRIAVLLVLTAILLNPVRREWQIQSHAPVVAILVDESKSMALSDEITEGYKDRLMAALPEDFQYLDPDTGRSVGRKDLTVEILRRIPRIDFVKALLATSSTEASGESLNVIRNLARRYPVCVYGFGRTAHSLVGSNTPEETGGDMRSAKDGVEIAGKLNATEPETALGGAIHDAIKDLRGRRIAAFVAITDGNSNSGVDPESAARSLRARGLPLFTVGIGNPEPPRDISLDEVEGPAKAVSRDYLSLQANFTVRGFGGREVEMVVKEGDQEHFRRTLRVKEGKNEEPMRFQLRDLGRHELTVEIVPLEGERAADNNRAVHVVSITDDPVRVLYIEGGARWEFRALKNSLLRDPAYLVTILLQKGPSELAEFNVHQTAVPTEDRRYALLPEAFDSLPDKRGRYREFFDVVILGDVSPALFTKEQVQALVEWVRKDAGGLLVIAGIRYMPAAWAGRFFGTESLEDILPVTVGTQVVDLENQPLGEDQLFQPELTPDGKRDVVCRLSTHPDENFNLWHDRLSPLYWYAPVEMAKPGARVLIQHPAQTSPRDQRKRVIVARQNAGLGQVLYVGTDELWRWRKRTGDTYHYRFYSQALMDLASKRSGARRFRLATELDRYVEGERVTVEADILNEQFEPDTAPARTLKVKHERSGQTRTFPLRRVTDKTSYEGTFTPPFGLGGYLLWVEEGGEEAELNPHRIVVENPNLEGRNQELREDVLRHLAASAGKGGEYLAIQDWPTLPKRIQADHAVHRQFQDRTLWHTWWVLVLFVVLITIEWVGRKRYRML